MAEPEPDALRAALESVDPVRRETLLELIRDASYVEPRVVSHLRD